MSWLPKQPRLTQVYAYVTAKLNDCGIRPDDAEVKTWIREELALCETPTSDEIATALYAMYTEKAKFYGSPNSAQLFREHPDFGGAGHELGVVK